MPERTHEQKYRRPRLHQGCKKERSKQANDSKIGLLQETVVAPIACTHAASTMSML